MTRPIDVLRARRAARGGAPISPVCADVERLLSLKLRSPQCDVTKIATLQSLWTQRLRNYHGKMTLRAAQAVALDEAERTQGLFANIGVGRGKALLSLLLPVVLGSKRCVLLVPAGLVEQTLHKVLPTMEAHWKLPTVGRPGSDATVIVVSHYEASQPKNARLFEQLKPDLYVIDEGDAFAGDSARARRLFDDKRRRPEVRVCAMSGTLIDSKLEKASRMASLCLGVGSPYPRFQDAIRLAVALDEGDVTNAQEFARLILPGKTLRQSILSRVESTPGVVVAPGVENIGASLVIRPRRPVMPPEAKAALKKLREDWVTPGGDELVEITDYARHMTELAQGFCYRWAWPEGPDDEWLTARRNWSRAVRRFLQRSPSPGMDSEGLLRKAAASGQWKTPHWEPWAAVMERKPPPVVTDWVSDFLVQDAVSWGNEAPGIIWYDGRVLGPRIAEAGGFKLYAGGAQDRRGFLDERGESTIVVSRNAHDTGLELQCFNRNYFCTAFSSAQGWEQVLGRSHRPGQKASEVTADVCVHTPELLKAFRAAQDEAKLLAEGSPGYADLKLLFADVLI